MLERNAALKNYSTLVANLWEDDSILSALKAEPHKVLSGYGFDIPADAEINLIMREIDIDDSPDTQVDLLNKGKETGVYGFIIPIQPEGMELQDIPLQDDILELVAGGQASMGESTACCCCPCCCGSELDK